MWLHISPDASIYASIIVASGFVGVLYLAPKSLRDLHRDDPRQVIFRQVASSLYCIVSLASFIVVGVYGSTAPLQHQEPSLDIQQPRVIAALGLARVG